LPLPAKHTLQVNHGEKKSESIWIWNKNLYKKILDFVLKWKYLSPAILTVFILIATVSFTKILKFEFMPEFDTTQVYINGSVGVGHDIKETEEKIYKLEKKILENFELGNEIDSISSVIGMKLDGKQMPQNEEFYFQIFVNLQERAPQNIFDRYINPYLSPKYDDTDMTRVEPAKKISNEISALIKSGDIEKEFDELTVYVPGAGIVKYDIEISLSGKDEKALAESINTIKTELSKVEVVKNKAFGVWIHFNFCFRETFFL
jgi:multidrug efflux pump subunit AcrB